MEMNNLVERSDECVGGVFNHDYCVFINKSCNACLKTEKYGFNMNNLFFYL